MDSSLELVITAVDSASGTLAAVQDQAAALGATVLDTAGEFATFGDSAAAGLDVAGTGFAAVMPEADAYRAVMAQLLVESGGVSEAIALVGPASDTAAAGLDVASTASKGLMASLFEFAPELLAIFGIYEGGKAIIKDFVGSNEQFQASQASINSTLQATHDAVGLTLPQLDALAAANSKLGVVSDNANLSAEQTLLSYNTLGKETFPEASAMVDDLATKMNGGLAPSMEQVNSAAKKLGKALEDPATGINSLTRMGISFSAQEKEQVKTIEDYTNATYAQALSIKGVSSAGAEALSKWSNLTSAQQTAAESADGLTASMIAQAEGFGKSNGTQAAQNQLLKDMSPLQGQTAGAADTLSGKIAIVKSKMDDAYIATGNFASKALPVVESAMNRGADVAGKMLAPAFAMLGPAVQQLTTVYEQHKKGIDDVGLAMEKLIEIGLWGAIETIKVLIEAVATGIRLFADWIQWISDTVDWFNRFGTAAENAINSVVKAVTSAFAGAGTWLYDVGRDIITGLINGIKAMIGGVTSAVGNVASGAVSAVKNLLGIHSPSTVFQEIGTNIGQGLITGINGSHAAVQNAVNSLVSTGSTGSINVNPSVDGTRSGGQVQNGVLTTGSPITAASNTGSNSQSGGNITLNVNIQNMLGTSNGVEQLASQLHQALIRVGRSNGIAVPTYGVRP